MTIRSRQVVLPVTTACMKRWDYGAENSRETWSIIGGDMPVVMVS